MLLIFSSRILGVLTLAVSILTYIHHPQDCVERSTRSKCLGSVQSDFQWGENKTQ